MEWSVCCATLVFATILLSSVEGNVPRPTLKPNATGHLIPKGSLRNGDCIPESSGNIEVIPVGETVCIQSPNFPKKYPNNALAYWWLDNSDSSGSLIVSCSPFKVKKTKKCRKDYLAIKYGDEETKYCGKKRPVDVAIPSYWVDFEFSSDAKKNSKGFRCYVTAVAGDGSTFPAGSTTQSPPGPSPTPAPPGPTGAPNPNCDCGIANHDRIVGGNPAGTNEYPWLVGIGNSGSSNWPWCGGSVYNSEWIITAAHCVDGKSAGSLKVMLGMHNWDNGVPDPTTRSVSQIIVHEGYNSNTVDNDIALLRLSSAVTLSSSIRPVCLPSPSDTYAGQTATATGWGTLESGGNQPDMNYEVQVPVVTQQECRNSYGTSEITDNMICAGTGSKDSCQGDSGGPLTVPNANGHHYLAGVVSWGYGCAQAPFYGVYAKVTNYISWITTRAGQPTCTP